jgi:spermidine synthase/S-adenosylmethionine/arginine decarboxylase-like enzyme
VSDANLILLQNPIASDPSKLEIIQRSASIEPTQHLHMDLSNALVADETELSQAAHRITERLGLHMVDVRVVNFGSESPGASLIAFLGETGHLTIHTWKNSQTILLDLLCTTQINLQEQTGFISDTLNTSMSSVTFSIIPRGRQPTSTNDKTSRQFEPSNIIPVHVFKQKLHEIESDKHRIEVWEYQDGEIAALSSSTDRQLFIDGNLQTSLKEEVHYYESLVHPAFVGSSSSLPPKRVLILGGGQGGTLREVLKYDSVEEVVMVHPDNAIMRVSRQFFPQLSDCLGFGSPNCFEDHRVSIHEQDFRPWFQSYFGKNLCRKREKRQDKLFDVIIVDWPYAENVPGKAEDFFDDLACAVSTFGVMTVSIGEAPEPTFSLSLESHDETLQHEVINDYTERLELIQAMSENFWHKRVYEIPLVTTGRMWSFATGMLPAFDDEEEVEDVVELQEGVFDGRTNGGINDFDGKPAMVNLKLRRGLQDGARLLFYDGAVQTSFRYPLADWKGLYCLDPNHQNVCNFANVFTKDYEEDIFELQLEADHNGRSGTVAKRDIPEGTVTGLWDAATDMDLPAVSFYRSRKLAEGKDTQFNDFVNWVDIYGYDGGSSGLGDRVMISFNSRHNFENHACDGQPNLGNAERNYPWTDIAFYDQWNPVGVRIQGELDHLKIASRDIKKGELVTDDYSKWDGFLQSTTGRYDVSRLERWCDQSRL